MTEVLVASSAGCLSFSPAGEGQVEFSGRTVGAIAAEAGGCLVVVDGNEIWRRNAGEWSLLARTSVELNSILSVDGKIFASTADVVLLNIAASGEAERLTGFDTISGRDQWFAQGPPLHIRSLTATADGEAMMAAVHVGGIPRSTDRGQTWAPTVPIDWDVHEVRGHPSLPHIVTAAAAVGLCVSEDGGRTWKVLSEGPFDPHALTVALLPDQVLFSIQDGPFAERSQVWRWKIGAAALEQVSDGLPNWLSGKTDTGHMAAGRGQAAIVDGGGNVWLSQEGSIGWQQIGTHRHYVYGVVVV